jgi:hypothetical protein
MQLFCISSLRRSPSVHLPSVLHEKAVDEYGAGQRSQRRLDFPLPPRAAETAARLPQVQQGGGLQTGSARV